MDYYHDGGIVGSQGTRYLLPNVPQNAAMRAELAWQQANVNPPRLQTGGGLAPNIPTPYNLVTMPGNVPPKDAEDLSRLFHAQKELYSTRNYATDAWKDRSDIHNILSKGSTENARAGAWNGLKEKQSTYNDMYEKYGDTYEKYKNHYLYDKPRRMMDYPKYGKEGYEQDPFKYQVGGDVNNPRDLGNPNNVGPWVNTGGGGGNQGGGNQGGGNIIPFDTNEEIDNIEVLPPTVDANGNLTLNRNFNNKGGTYPTPTPDPPTISPFARQAGNLMNLMANPGQSAMNLPRGVNQNLGFYQMGGSMGGALNGMGGLSPYVNNMRDSRSRLIQNAVQKLNPVNQFKPQMDQISNSPILQSFGIGNNQQGPQTQPQAPTQQPPQVQPQAPGQQQMQPQQMQQPQNPWTSMSQPMSPQGFPAGGSVTTGYAPMSTAPKGQRINLSDRINGIGNDNTLAFISDNVPVPHNIYAQGPQGPQNNQMMNNQYGGFPLPFQYGGGFSDSFLGRAAAFASHEARVRREPGDPWEYKKTDGKWRTRKIGADKWYTAKGTPLAAIKNRYEPGAMSKKQVTMLKRHRTKKENEGMGGYSQGVSNLSMPYDTNPPRPNPDISIAPMLPNTYMMPQRGFDMPNGPTTNYDPSTDPELPPRVYPRAPGLPPLNQSVEPLGGYTQQEMNSLNAPQGGMFNGINPLTGMPMNNQYGGMAQYQMGGGIPGVSLAAGIRSGKRIFNKYLGGLSDTYGYLGMDSVSDKIDALGPEPTTVSESTGPPRATGEQFLNAGKELGKQITDHSKSLMDKPGSKKISVSRRDPEVLKQQQDLISRGYELPRYGADGIMGPETRAAIARYESEGLATHRATREYEAEVYRDRMAGYDDEIAASEALTGTSGVSSMAALDRAIPYTPPSFDTIDMLPFDRSRAAPATRKDKRVARREDRREDRAMRRMTRRAGSGIGPGDTPVYRPEDLTLPGLGEPGLGFGTDHATPIGGTPPSGYGPPMMPDFTPEYGSPEAYSGPSISDVIMSGYRTPGRPSPYQYGGHTAAPMLYQFGGPVVLFNGIL